MAHSDKKKIPLARSPLRNVIAKYGLSTDLKELARVYNLVRSYEDLLLLGQAFLRGEMSQLPHYVGPIDDETKPLVSLLLDLHARGKLFTLDSQPGECVDVQESSSGEWFRSEQKASLIFLIPKVLFPLLDVVFQDASENIYYFAGTLDGDGIVSTFPEKNYALEPREDEDEDEDGDDAEPYWLVDTTSNDQSHPVTRARPLHTTGKYAEKNNHNGSNAIWNTETIYPISVDPALAGVYGEYPAMWNIIRQKCFFVAVTSKKWCDNDSLWNVMRKYVARVSYFLNYTSKK